MKYIITPFLICCFLQTQAQYPLYTWHFDGADTVTMLKIQFDTTHANNTWQIGKPQKTVFNSAYSAPNVLITDTLHTYPSNDTSIFVITFKNPVSFSTSYWWPGQISFFYRLNMDSTETAKIEMSLDSGVTWMDVLKDSVHGFMKPNSLGPNSDTGWRMITIGFNDFFWGHHTGDNLLRFTVISDSVDTHKDGWMIDNMVFHYFTEEIKEIENPGIIHIYPNPSKGKIKIDGPTGNVSICVYDLSGKKVFEKKYNNVPDYLDLPLPNGTYILECTKDNVKERKKIIINR